MKKRLIKVAASVCLVALAVGVLTDAPMLWNAWDYAFSRACNYATNLQLQHAQQETGPSFCTHQASNFFGAAKGAAICAGIGTVVGGPVGTFGGAVGCSLAFLL